MKYLFFLFLTSCLLLCGASATQAQFAYVTNHNSATVSIINLATNVMVGIVPVGQNPMSLLKNAENTRLYVIGTSSNDITVIDLASHTVVATIPLSNGAYFFGMAITPDGRHLYVSEFNFGSGSVVDVVNTQSGQIETVIPVGLGPVDMTMTQDGRKVYVSNAYSSNISVIETETNTVVATLPCGGITPRCLQLIDNEQKLLVANANSHNLALIDLNLEQVVSTIPTGKAPNYFTTVCGDGYEGTKVYVSCRGDHLNPASIDVVHLEKGAVTTRLAVNDAPLGSILAPDGTHLYVAVGNNQAAYLDTQTDAITSYITVGSSPRFMTHSASAPVYTIALFPPTPRNPH